MLVDSVKCATLVNGVVRIGLSYRNASGDEVTAGEIMVPAGQLAGLAQSLAQLGARLGAGDGTRAA
ncbi:hypothetical protein [Sphingobium sp. CFD-2]|uniref:hypothetical protein n=1 Tax=Sphingobium sp. CFD-2 TaxID=2878542 RepID=UPI00214B7E80|nr:hypothetical protein [Sphingobium sp. CFD-2]